MVKSRLSLYAVRVFIILGIPMSLGCDFSRPALWDGGIGDGPIQTGTTDLFTPEGDGSERIYRFKTNDRSASRPRGKSYWFPLSGEGQTPFSAWEVTVNKINGRRLAGFGIIMCHQTDSGGVESMLTVMIRVSGEYQIAEVVGADYQEFAPWQSFRYIRKGYGLSNTMRIVRVNDQFVLSINGEEVERFHDNNDAPTHTGGIQGFLVVISPLEAFPSRPVEVTFKVEG